MYTIDNTTITMTRGDTVRVRFPLYVDDAPYSQEAGDQVLFIVNTSDRQNEPPILIKELTDFTLQLDPEDTKNLDFGTYRYDVQITFADSDDVITYLNKEKLKIVWEAD